ncbi:MULTISPECIES: MarR family transcriptional regulator [Microbacterium]|uniref:DNA-binding transcriptional regulator, MarR family n=1 Tax=Microbacterium saccharophilum TaxID=1213358 RepID=A0A7Z7GE11_9MICO|nr:MULTISPECIES: MarR family transcriptional regulator [Microbacterium]SFI59684.1 DNA-binding transcriptional regulator, MarR family [Microbacterium saccharophilum]
MSLDAARLAAVISPLRRALAAAARQRDRLPHIPDSHVDVIRALPRGTVRSPGDLSILLGLNRTTVSNLLTAMEINGLVARRPRADDRRHVEVVASAEALALADRFDAVSTAIVADAAAELSAGERDALAAALPALEHLHDLLVAQRARAIGPAEHQNA